MKKLLALLLFALPCMGQNPLFITSSFNTATAATPTFSPAAGAVVNPTTVTASTATGGCSSYIYFDTSNPPTTNQTTYSVTAPVTLYAQVRGCPGYNDSAVSPGAAYTILTWPFTDNFTRANASTLGANYTEGPSSPYLRIISNTATCALNDNNRQVALLSTSSGYTLSANQEVSVVFSAVGAQPQGAILRATDVNNYEVVLFKSASIELQKTVSGTNTYIGLFSGSAPNLNHTYNVTAIGSSYALYDNGTKVGSTLTDATYSSGQTGMVAFSTSNSTPIAFTSFSTNVCTSTCP